MKTMKPNYRQHLGKFLIYLEKELKSPKNTISTYDNGLSRFFYWATEKDLPHVQKLTRHDVKLFISELDLSPSTIDNYVSSIKAMWDYLMDVDVVKINITSGIRRPKKKKNVIKYLSIEEGIQFIKESENYKTLSEIANYRCEVMAKMFLFCGLRLSELTNVKVSDIKNGTLKITNGKGGKQRELEIHDVLIEAIDKFMKYREENNIVSEWLFISQQEELMSRNKRQASVSIIRHDVMALFEKIGRSDLSPHALRRSYAMEKIMSNEDILTVQQLLGHSSIVTTRIYVEAHNEKVKKASKKSLFA